MNLKNLFKSKSLLSRFTLIMFLVLHCGLLAQNNVTVKGIVKGEDGMPIPGAAVLLEGTKVGAVTDFDGNYNIPAKTGDVLVFSYLGMTPKSVKVTGSILNVTLQEQASQLDEVVVIGYGSVKKKELTGAVAIVKSEDIEQITTSDLGTALQGQVSGVNIVSSSTPGGTSEILIRGVTTLQDNTPLYVVDGIIQEGDPRIPPSDIESINILKDAASTAIYGSRGATGVILITTKQGKAGTLQVRLNGSYAIQNRRAAVPLMNSLEQTYFDVVQQRNTQGALDDRITALQILNNPIYFQNETDLNKLIFRNNVPTQDYNANISGGTQDITYNVTLGWFNQEGLQINSAYNRFNTRANTVYERNKLRIQTSIGLNIDQRDIPQSNLLSQAIVYRPTQNGIELESFDDISQGGNDVNRLGWVLETLRTEQDLKTVRTNASFAVNYELLEGLSLSSNVGLTTTNSIGKEKRPFQAIYNNQNPPVLQTQPSNSYIEMTTLYRTSLSAELGATYVKQIMDDHKLTFGLFVTTEKYKQEQFSARREGVTNPDANVLDLATGNQSVSSGFDYTDTRIGTIARVQYDYKGRYFLSSSVRRDGSSKFGTDNQWGTFPSVALAWNISDESFWSSFEKINNFRLRLSHGSVGNDRITSYSFVPGIEQNINYIGMINGVEQLNLGATQTSFANELLKWETTTQSNIGIDLGFFKNKLTLSAEYYYANKEDMLFPVFLPLSAGGGNNARVVLNVGNMTNEGFELALGYKMRTGKFNWNMNGTFSTNKNVITKINGTDNFILTDDFGLVGRAPLQSRVTALAVGREAAAFYLWRTNGIIDTEEKLADYQKINSAARMGDVIYIDQNNDNQLDNDDRVYSGSGLPEYEIGYTCNITFKSFDFSMNWYAAIGQEIMNGFDAWAYGYGRHKDQIYQWSEANPVTSIPAYRDDIQKHPNFLGYSDLWLEDGSYLRLRQVSLGYSIPKKTVEKWGFNRLRFYVRAQNPLTLTKYSGYNPEVGGGISSRGLDKDTGPVSSSYFVGINFNF
ncbi:SusC/RagA family TonB-linked outer membrane protein [Mariniflexile aquimaris]|uniref:SusC/RagA family TonB-linked outer membrane protein n=1 Tax=Mariniflexile aquimaris TaxID=881009 RepID=A0ABW3BTL3_9FLAO